MHTNETFVDLDALDDYLLEQGGEYRVLTDDEADAAATEDIRECLWAFNPSFLSGYTGLDEEVFQAIQDNNRCESNNDAILSLVEGNGGLEGFVEEATSCDGRGHFLSCYDGEEYEFDVDGETYFVYRTN